MAEYFGCFCVLSLIALLTGCYVDRDIIVVNEEGEPQPGAIILYSEFNQSPISNSGWAVANDEGRATIQTRGGFGIEVFSGFNEWETKFIANDDPVSTISTQNKPYDGSRIEYFLEKGLLDKKKVPEDIKIFLMDQNSSKTVKARALD